MPEALRPELLDERPWGLIHHSSQLKSMHFHSCPRNNLPYTNRRGRIQDSSRLNNSTAAVSSSTICVLPVLLLLRLASPCLIPRPFLHPSQPPKPWFPPPPVLLQQLDHEILRQTLRRHVLNLRPRPVFGIQYPAAPGHRGLGISTIQRRRP